MAVVTLENLAVTNCTLHVPAWGCWHANIVLASEKTLSGKVTLKFGDAAYKGAVVSGGVYLGRSHYKIVGGAGGWGKQVSAKSYANDAGVKASLVLGDLASEVGETLVVSADKAVGVAFVRHAGRASQALQEIFPSGWYVDETGTTRTGARASSTLRRKVTQGETDKATGTVQILSDEIADLVPGLVLPEGVVSDAVHELTAEGVRTTLRLSQNSTVSRLPGAIAALGQQLAPSNRYLGIFEYRVVDLTGNRANLQPVRKATGLPDLLRVPIRGPGGVDVEPVLGARCLVGFVDGDPASPYVAAFEEIDGEGFTPTMINLTAGSQVGGEHLATVEATCLLIYNTLVALLSTAGGGPLIAAALQPLIGPAILTALTAQVAPAPTGTTAQNAAATAQLAGFATGAAPATTSLYFASAISGLSAKTPNVSGKFPSIGCKARKGG